MPYEDMDIVGKGKSGSSYVSFESETWIQMGYH